MLQLALKSLISGFSKIVMSYIPIVLGNMFIDAFDEAMESLLEKAEKKANETPDKSDDRRLALYRKYWEGFKEYRKRNGKEISLNTGEK